MSNLTYNFTQNKTVLNCSNQNASSKVCPSYEALWDICLNLRNYGSICIFIIGFLFNFVTICSFSNKKMVKNCNLTIYIIGLSLSNQMKLLFEMPFIKFAPHLSNSICNLIVWARFSFGEISSWLLVLLVIDCSLTSRMRRITEITDKPENASIWRLIIVGTIFCFFFIKNSTLLIINVMADFDFFSIIK